VKQVRYFLAVAKKSLPKKTVSLGERSQGPAGTLGELTTWTSGSSW